MNKSQLWSFSISNAQTIKIKAIKTKIVTEIRFKKELIEYVRNISIEKNNVVKYSVFLNFNFIHTTIYTLTDFQII